MIKKLLVILLFLLTIPAMRSFAIEEELKNETVTIKQPEPLTQHTVDVTYPFSNQARMHSLVFQVEDEGGKKALKISARIDNVLSRNLINANVTIQCFDQDHELLITEKKDVIPNRVEKGGRPGTFHITADYLKDITACRIQIDWIGKSD